MRISVTTIESFRMMKEEDWFSEARFLEQLSSKFISTPAMEFGTAYHALIEDGEINYICAKLKNMGMIQPALNYRAKFPDLVHEIKAIKEYLINGEIITVVGKCDGLYIDTIHEHKTCAVFEDKYEQSVQYKFYFELFGGREVQYNIFELKGANKKATNVIEFVESINAIKYHKLIFDKPKNNSDYCYSLLSELVLYIKNRGLERYFKDKP